MSLPEHRGRRTKKLERTRFKNSWSADCRPANCMICNINYTGRVYTVYDISAFARAGQRAHTSPADEVIMDLITLGVTVDSLYRILHTMDARQCMEALARHGNTPFVV